MRAKPRIGSGRPAAAAVLRCGRGAVISGLAAAYLYGLIKTPPRLPEVSAPLGARAPGIRTRRRTVASRRRKGIPTITIAQTVIDLAAVLDIEALGRVCHEAEVRFHLKKLEIPSTPGAAKLRAIYHGDHAVLLSRLEKNFGAQLMAHALPLPKTNRPEGEHYVDCRWPGRPLPVELDSFQVHHTRHAWEEDRERERAARRRGDEFRRYTWRDVVEEPAQMLAELEGLLDI